MTKLYSSLQFLVQLLVITSCATIEKGSYGVRDFDIEGTEEMGEDSLKQCLLTVEHPTVGITLGLSPSGCEVPPFDKKTPRLRLWRRPFKDYQTFNEAVVEHDIKRVLRWYQARGFYDAKVVEVRFDPEEARESVDSQLTDSCNPDEDRCKVDILIVIEEGKPIHIEKVSVSGLENISAKAKKLVSKLKLPEHGDRFDEFYYDAGKRDLAEALAEASYATAEVTGKVVLNHEAKTASIAYHVAAGPSYRFGKVIVEGAVGLPKDKIVAAADLPKGELFAQSALKEVQQEVYALGAFSAVAVERTPSTQQGVMDVLVSVSLLPKDAWRLGIGVMSGAQLRTETGELAPIPQWDIHLLTRYERRHIFGTLGKLRIEDRPRMIFHKSFPGLMEPKWGNVLKLSISQPGLIEKRTNLILTTQWDFGPDSFQGFQRHDTFARLSAKRAFFRRHVFATLSIQQDYFHVLKGETTSDGGETPVSYGFSFLEEDLRLDLRDNPSQPRMGAYLGLLASQAPKWAGSGWTAFRLAPEIRGYLPLPFHMVFAARFAVAGMFIIDAASYLDDTSRELGPTTYRLRGGGATSNRGFLPGRLGAGLEGGLRRWEASGELRIRLGSKFSVVGFGDLGDVIREPELNFDDPNPSVGFGMRYFTPFGAIRFDMGFRVGSIGPDDNKLLLIDVPGAIHLTIGESF